jgi:nucleoside 2-deoxyribosyltransferase
MKLIYLASPYNDESADLREKRYQEACKACVWLMCRGWIVYSPIVHNHPLATNYDLPKGWDFWQRADTCTLERCDEMLILTIDGWDTSRGIKAERAFAIELKIPIQQMTPVVGGYAFRKDE